MVWRNLWAALACTWESQKVEAMEVWDETVSAIISQREDLLAL